MWRRDELGRAHGEARRSDIERREAWPPEGATRRPTAWHFDHPVEGAIGRIADQAGAAGDAAGPHEPLGIEAGAIRRAALKPGEDGALVVELPGPRLDAIGIELIPQRIGCDQPAAGKDQRVGDAEAILAHSLDPAVCRDPIEPAGAG